MWVPGTLLTNGSEHKGVDFCEALGTVQVLNKCYLCKTEHLLRSQLWQAVYHTPVSLWPCPTLGIVADFQLFGHQDVNTLCLSYF